MLIQIRRGRRRMRKQLDDSPGLRASWYAATWTKAHGQSTAGHAHTGSQGGPHRCMHRAHRLHAVAWVRRLRTRSNLHPRGGGGPSHHIILHHIPLAICLTNCKHNKQIIVQLIVNKKIK